MLGSTYDRPCFALAASLRARRTESSHRNATMGVPQVVIVGRPNVGKSSIFNWLAHKRLAIVDGTAGVTRDRVTYLMFDRERYFELVDTGGIGFDDPDNLTARSKSRSPRRSNRPT